MNAGCVSIHFPQHRNHRVEHFGSDRSCGVVIEVKSLHAYYQFNNARERYAPRFILNTMRIAVAADHAGFDLKGEVAAYLLSLGHEVTDLSPGPPDPLDDYPDSAALIAHAIEQGQAERGILICGSGVGASVAANKVKGIRAALCHDTYSAHQGVEHDDMNILVFGARVIGIALANELAHAFVDAKYTGEERHARRLGKVLAMEQNFGQ
jgi:RpiB/LacA/LacB family sugar-phosphate isomerase